MTEQEAEGWAKRLTRIWGAPPRSTEQPTAKWRLREGRLEFRMAITSDIYLFAFGAENMILTLDRRQINTESPRVRWHDGIQTGLLSCDSNSFYSKSDPAPQCQEFIHEWMDFFRRGCWLSGCPIEATAHEKAEWMQGFSSEEVEAWNLKM